MERLTLALPKGRLFEETVNLLTKAGLLKEPLKEGRKLVLETDGLRILLAKPKDVPTLVESGYADLGVSGFDTLWESKKEVFELLDLKVGFCRICIAGFPESRELYENLSSVKVATKYPNIARDFFESKGVKPFIYYMNGSVELAPLIGMTDFILDLVQTGRTLRENGLVVIEEIATSTARLVANRESFFLKNGIILDFVRRLERVV
ncbi:MAG: ATP phosphoribosyltransferase [Aquificae bacterium]|nr:ATP phosphoribosyltransferase [Aquificota bacterium]